MLARLAKLSSNVKGTTAEFQRINFIGTAGVVSGKGSPFRSDVLIFTQQCIYHKAAHSISLDL